MQQKYQSFSAGSVGEKPWRPSETSLSQFVPAEKNTRQSADEESAAKWKTTREATISFDLRR